MLNSGVGGISSSPEQKTAEPMFIRFFYDGKKRLLKNGLIYVAHFAIRLLAVKISNGLGGDVSWYLPTYDNPTPRSPHYNGG